MPSDRSTADPPRREIRHPALDGGGGRPLDRARLSELERLALVFQGAALLAHLEHGGLYLPDRWRGARVTKSGVLRVAAVARGRAPDLPQVALLELLDRLFRRRGGLKGRGRARLAARRLSARWQQTLAPYSPDRAVADILDAAPFLWQPAFAAARTALVAEHRIGERRTLWLAGPGDARRRFLGRRGKGRLAEVEELLASPEARDLWQGWQEDLDPEVLATKRRWRQAVALWRRRPPRWPRQVLAYGRCLFACGRYSRTLRLLRQEKGFEAGLLCARCQLYLGELNIGLATVRRLADESPSPRQTVRLAEVAIRLLAARGRRREIRGWITLALSDARGKVKLEAGIVAAGAAWDLGDLAAMDRFLADSRPAVGVPELAGRWHHVRGLRSIEAGDGLGAVEHISAALRLDRRRLLPAEAGRLWNDLAIGRAFADDLPAAERACRHALRLLSDSEGPSRTTLALYNLAELRLRRGRVAGVERTLESSTAENRRAGNHRGLILDLELWVRLELAQGRAAAALARCAEARREVAAANLEGRRGVFEVLAARAHGWLDRRDEAAACLEAAGSAAALRELESEERAAVWALADRPRSALEEAASTPWQGLWTALLSGSQPPPEVWHNLSSLEPFRAARLVFDCELVAPGVVPPTWVRRAIDTLRRVGADALAEKLESRALGPWRALENYLAQATVDARSVTDLLHKAGYADARLSWWQEDREQVVVKGAGGEERLEAEVGDGKWVLRSAVADRVLATLLTLIRRDLEPPRRRGESGDEMPPAHGIVGRSPALVAALRRLDQLAAGDLPILLLGESGTGKELFARRAHRASRRGSRPFQAVNCAALSENLVQSELFGHVRGSFTGADRDRTGVFESAQGGTVLLDEIGDLPLDAQGKLLRVLQEGEIRRVGESFSRKINVRVVAATHRDLEQMVADKSFRQDLFYRLKVATIRLPPLCERGGDILLLADHFLTRGAAGGPRPRLSPVARERILGHGWPGNVRELLNVLEVAAALAVDGQIENEHLDLPRDSPAPQGDYHRRVEGFRKKLITEALTAAAGNRSQAARRLGLSRQALSYLIRQLGLS